MSLDLFGLSPPMPGQESLPLVSKSQKEFSDRGEFASMLDAQDEKIPDDVFMFNQGAGVNQQFPQDDKVFKPDLSICDVNAVNMVYPFADMSVYENLEIPLVQSNPVGALSGVGDVSDVFSVGDVSDKVVSKLTGSTANVIPLQKNPFVKAFIQQQNVPFTNAFVGQNPFLDYPSGKIEIPQPEVMHFSPSLLGFADHGLDELILNGQKAGITDGKEVQNLINKFISRFDLDPELVKDEFSKLAVIPAREKTDFNLGEFFEKLGVESRDLDSAYKMVNDLVEREFVKEQIKSDFTYMPDDTAMSADAAYKTNSKLDELLLAARYINNKQGLEYKQSPQPDNTGMDPKTATSLLTEKTAVKNIRSSGKERGFGDFLSKDDSMSFMIDSAMKSQGLVAPQKFEISQPIQMLKVESMNDVSSMRDAVVHDAKILLREGGGKMDISLMPGDMGKLQVKVDTHGSQVQVEVLCSNPQVKHMLESQMGELKLSLAGANLVIDKMEVGLAQNTSGSSFNSQKEGYEERYRGDGFTHRDNKRDNWDGNGSNQRRKG